MEEIRYEKEFNDKMQGSGRNGFGRNLFSCM